MRGLWRRLTGQESRDDRPGNGDRERLDDGEQDRWSAYGLGAMVHPIPPAGRIRVCRDGS